MITLKEAYDIVKSHYKGCLIYAYDEYKDFWLFCLVSDDDGEILIGIWSPIVYKSDGHLDSYSSWHCQPLPKPISGGIFPEREQYREKFSVFSMKCYGHQYKFPDERDDEPIIDENKDIQPLDEPPKKSRLEKLSDSLLSLFGIS